MTEPTTFQKYRPALEAGTITIASALANHVNPLATQTGALVCSVANITSLYATENASTIWKIGALALTALAIKHLPPTLFGRVTLGSITPEALVQFASLAAVTKVSFYACSKIGTPKEKVVKSPPSMPHVTAPKVPNKKQTSSAFSKIGTPKEKVIKSPPSMPHVTAPKVPSKKQTSSALKVSLLALGALAGLGGLYAACQPTATPPPVKPIVPTEDPIDLYGPMTNETMPLHPFTPKPLIHFDPLPVSPMNLAPVELEEELLPEIPTELSSLSNSSIPISPNTVPISQVVAQTLLSTETTQQKPLVQFDPLPFCPMNLAPVVPQEEDPPEIPTELSSLSNSSIPTSPNTVQISQVEAQTLPSPKTTQQEPIHPPKVEENLPEATPSSINWADMNLSVITGLIGAMGGFFIKKPKTVVQTIEKKVNDNTALESLEADFESLEKEKNKLDKQLTALKEKEKEKGLESELSQLKSTQEQEQTNHQAALQQKEDEHNKKIRKLTSKLEKATKAKASLEATISSQKKQLKGTKEQNQTAVTQLQEKFKRKTADTQRLSQQIQQLREQIKEKEQAHKKEKQALENSFKAKEDKFKEQIAKLEEERSRLAAHIRELEAEMEQTQLELAEVSSQVAHSDTSSLYEESEVLLDHGSASPSHETNDSKDISELQKQIMQLKASNQQLMESKEGLSDEIENFIQQLVQKLSLNEDGEDIGYGDILGKVHELTEMIKDQKNEFREQLDKNSRELKKRFEQSKMTVRQKLATYEAGHQRELKKAEAIAEKNLESLRKEHERNVEELQAAFSAEKAALDDEAKQFRVRMEALQEQNVADLKKLEQQYKQISQLLHKSGLAIDETPDSLVGAIAQLIEENRKKSAELESLHALMAESADIPQVVSNSRDTTLDTTATTFDSDDAEIDALEAEIKALEAENEEFQTKIANLEQTLEESENGSLIKLVKRVISNLRASISESIPETTSIDRLNASTEDVFSDPNSVSNNLSTVVTNVIRVLGQLNDKIESAGTDVARKSLDEALADMFVEEATKKLLAEKEELNAEISSLKKDLSLEKASNQRLMLDNRSLKASAVSHGHEKQKEKQRSTELQDSYETMLSQFSQNLAKLEIVQGELAKEKKLREGYQKDWGKQEDEIMKLKEEIQQKSTELERLKSNMVDAIEHQHVTDGLEALRLQLEKAEKKRRELERTRREQEKALEEAEEKNESLTERFNYQKGELSRIKTALLEEKAARKKLSNQLEE